MRFLWMLLIVSLCSCSGSSSVTEPLANSPVANFSDQTMPVTLPSTPSQLQALAQAGNLLTEVPLIVDHRVLANTGLQIVYTEPNQAEVADALEIEYWWVYMQQCLEQTAQVPIVLVRRGVVKPFTADDDLLFHYGVPVASATGQDHNILQISDSDFDGSLGDAGFYFRSMIGRYLWAIAHLKVGEYPYHCASQTNQ